MSKNEELENLYKTDANLDWVIEYLKMAELYDIEISEYLESAQIWIIHKMYEVEHS